MPVFADGCELDLQGDGRIVRIVAGIDPAAAELRERAPVAAVEGEHPIVAILRGGPARLLDLDDPDDAPLFGPADAPASARALGMTTAVLAPVQVGGTVIGSLSFGRGPSGRRFFEADVATAIDVARNIGLAWHNALLLDERASIVAALHDGLVVSDAEGVVLEVNDRWTELTGFTADQCVGATMPYPWWPDADDDAGTLDAAVTALGGGHTEQRVVFRRADGTLFPALVSVSPVVDRGTGERRALVASVKDVTDWEAARADLDAIQRLTSRLAAAGDMATIATTTLREVIARTGAEAAFILRLDPGADVLHLVTSHGTMANVLGERTGYALDRAAPTIVAVRDGVTVVVSSAEELLERFPDVLPEAEDVGVESVVAVPVRRQAQSLGAIALWSNRPAAFGPRDVAFLEAAAAQYAQTLPRAEGYELEHRASQALQRRLLSDVPVLHERATIATRYQPASTDIAVGGDWYDVVQLDGERLAIVVGDVVGSGIEAAAVMGQLRSALKGIALVTPDPVAVLDTLDHVAAGIGGAPAATVCYVLLDLANGEVRFARAGHLPPLVVSTGPRGGAHFLEGHCDLPLGLRHGGRREATDRLAPGDVLVLYTDGLVERRNTVIDERLEHLRTVAASARDGSIEELVDGLLAGCVGDMRLRDDLAVIAVRDEPATADRFRRVISARAHELSPLRRALLAWLQERRIAEEVVDGVVLAANEAVTNAIEHAYGDVLGGAGHVLVVACADDTYVTVEVRDAGRWQARPSHTSRGRGLSMARQVGAVDVRSGPSGTTVTIRASLSGRRTRGR